MNTCHRIVFLRHGQSIWNLENRFTGWTDVPLTEQGRAEARQAARWLAEGGCTFDLAFTSVLRRSVETLDILLPVMNLQAIPVVQDWQLNERHYGALQGLNKAEMALRLGQDRVTYWRRSFDGRPPALEWDDRRHPRFDDRYAFLSRSLLPRTESLQDTLARVLPVWQNRILPAVRAGQQVLVVAHGNSLRALVTYLDQIPDEQVPGVNIPTGRPLAYELDENHHPISRRFIAPQA